MKQKIPNVGDCLLLEISYDGKKISLPTFVSHVKKPSSYSHSVNGGNVTAGSIGVINLFGDITIKTNKEERTTDDISIYKGFFQIRFNSNISFNYAGSKKSIKIYVEDSDTETRPNLHAVANELSLPDTLIKTSYISITESFPKFNINFRKL